MKKLKPAVFSLLLLGLIATILELAGALLLRIYPDYDKVRQVLAGHTQDNLRVGHTIAVTAQPYLFYIETPHFRRNGVLQHNASGYRGTEIPVRREPGRIRILFIGGSTTYGIGVDRPEEAYPEQVGQILRATGTGQSNTLEIINGGLEFGTSAEMLTHYHFKYHYYRPDIVVIDTGGNDAYAYYQAPYYHPDYSHWRQSITAVKPLRLQSRWMAHSRLIGFLIVHLFYPEVVDGKAYLRTNGEPPQARWFPDIARAPDGRLVLGEADIAFAHNTEALIREVLHDGAEILLVPFRENPAFRFKNAIPADFRRHEEILRQLATTYGLPMAPFPAEVIQPGDWVDRCHVNARGQRSKAEHVAPFLSAVISNLARSAGSADPSGDN